MTLDAEQLLTYPQAAAHPALRVGGQMPNRQQVSRWTRVGLRNSAGVRVVLESIRTPLGPRTSVEAIHRFREALNTATVKPIMSAATARRSDQAMAFMQQCGWA